MKQFMIVGEVEGNRSESIQWRPVIDAPAKCRRFFGETSALCIGEMSAKDRRDSGERSSKDRRNVGAAIRSPGRALFDRSGGFMVARSRTDFAWPKARPIAR